MRSLEVSFPETITYNPRCLAIGTAIWPKLPDPPAIKTVCPLLTFNTSVNPWYVVSPVSGTAGPVTKSRFLGKNQCSG